MDNKSNSEKWAAVSGYEGIYEVSDQGRVRSLSRDIKLPNGASRPWRGRVMRLHKNGSGYPSVRLSHPERGSKSHPVHRLVAFAFLGEPPQSGPYGYLKTKYLVAHNDGIKTNCAASNLRWATTLENGADRVLHGHAPQGERHANSKLTDNDAREIRRRYDSGERIDVIAKGYPIVCEGTVAGIATRRTWRRVE